MYLKNNSASNIRITTWYSNESVVIPAWQIIEIELTNDKIDEFKRFFMFSPSKLSIATAADLWWWTTNTLPKKVQFLASDFTWTWPFTLYIPASAHLFWASCDYKVQIKNWNSYTDDVQTGELFENWNLTITAQFETFDWQVVFTDTQN